MTDRERRQRADRFLNQPPEQAFAEYDDATAAERFDLLGLLDPDQRRVFEAALAERSRTGFSFAGGDGGGFGVGAFVPKGRR